MGVTHRGVRIGYWRELCLLIRKAFPERGPEQRRFGNSPCDLGAGRGSETVQGEARDRPLSWGILIGVPFKGERVTNSKGPASTKRDRRKGNCCAKKKKNCDYWFSSVPRAIETSLDLYIPKSWKRKEVLFEKERSKTGKIKNAIP